MGEPAFPRCGEEWQRRRGRRRRWVVLELVGPARPARGCKVRLREPGPGREEVIAGVPVRSWDELEISLETFRRDYERAANEPLLDREASSARDRALATHRRHGDLSSAGFAVLHGERWAELEDLPREIWRAVVTPLLARAEILCEQLAARGCDPPGVEVVETPSGWIWQDHAGATDVRTPPAASELDARRAAWRAFAASGEEDGHA